MGPIDATITCMRKALTWKGRAAPSEFWWFTLTHTVIMGAAAMLVVMPYIHVTNAYFDAVTQAEIVAYNTWTEVVPPPLPDYLALTASLTTNWAIYLAISIWPALAYLAALVRRLHDTGRSGWWYWISLVPFVGGLLLLILLIVPGDIYRNAYGPGRSTDLTPRARGNDMPVVPRDPLAHLQTADDMRGLRHSRMQS